MCLGAGMSCGDPFPVIPLGHRLPDAKPIAVISDNSVALPMPRARSRTIDP